MAYCSKCKVKIQTNHTLCPLCQNKIENNGEEVFPYVPTPIERYSTFFRILLISSILISALMVLLDFIIPTKHHFSIYVIAGLLCLFILLKISLTKRENLPRSILWQVIAISILVCLWDYFTGWRGWSITYVVPIVCIVGSIDMSILAKVMKLYIDEQFIYFLDIFLLGLVPTIFLLTDIVYTDIPSLICIFLNVIAFFLILILRWDMVIQEVKRRFHI